MAAPDADWLSDFMLSDLKWQCRLAGLPLPPSPKRPRRDDGDDGALARIRAELAVSPAYVDMMVPLDTPLSVLQAEMAAMQDLCDAPEPPGDPGDCGRRLREHIARLQRRIDAFDADL